MIQTEATTMVHPGEDVAGLRAEGAGAPDASEGGAGEPSPTLPRWIRIRQIRNRQVSTMSVFEDRGSRMGQRPVVLRVEGEVGIRTIRGDVSRRSGRRFPPLAPVVQFWPLALGGPKRSARP